MKKSRRDFFTKLGATAAALALTPNIALSAIISDPRVKAWVLLDESEELFNAEGKSHGYFRKTEELFEHLMDHFLPTVPPSLDSAVQECGDLLKRRGKFDSIDPKAGWDKCYPSTFAVMIVRDGLKYKKLPMIQAPNWKRFAKNYTSIVMAA